MGADSVGPNDALLMGFPVLVVEDSWYEATALKSALEKVGMQVIGPTATTAEARSLFAAQRPGLALVDANLKHETSRRLVDDLHEEGVCDHDLGLRRSADIQTQRGSIPAEAGQLGRINYDGAYGCRLSPFISLHCDYGGRLVGSGRMGKRP